jgi:hypothetical protein
MSFILTEQENFTESKTKQQLNKLNNMKKQNINTSIFITIWISAIVIALAFTS